MPTPQLFLKEIGAMPSGSDRSIISSHRRCFHFRGSFVSDEIFATSWKRRLAPRSDPGQNASKP